MNKSTGTSSGGDWVGQVLTINIPEGCNGFIVGVRKTLAADDFTFADYVNVNVDALHEDVELGLPIFKGGVQEFRSQSDIIRKVTITASGTIPVIDFGVISRVRSED